MSCSVTPYQPGSTGALDPGQGTRGRITQLVEHLTEKPGTILPCVARDFPPRANSQCRLSYGVHTAAGVQSACQHLCAHQKSQTLAAIP